jgi:hypothetical protein
MSEARADFWHMLSLDLSGVSFTVNTKQSALDRPNSCGNPTESE